jgi:hypothetical protein
MPRVNNKKNNNRKRPPIQGYDVIVIASRTQRQKLANWDIPIPIIIKIVSWLNQEDLMNMSLVSKQLHNIIANDQPSSPIVNPDQKLSSVDNVEQIPRNVDLDQNLTSQPGPRLQKERLVGENDDFDVNMVQCERCHSRFPEKDYNVNDFRTHRNNAACHSSINWKCQLHNNKLADEQKRKQRVPLRTPRIVPVPSFRDCTCFCCSTFWNKRPIRLE